MILNLPGILVAQRHSSEFMSKTSEEIGNAYNPNPDWFQKIMDQNEGKFSEQETSPPRFERNESISLPWEDGFLIFFGGVAYIIEYEFTGYCEIKLPNGVDNSVDLFAAMEAAMSALLVGYEFGVKEGRRQKINEFQNFLKE